MADFLPALFFAVTLSVTAAEPLPNTKIEALPQTATLPTDTPAQIALGRLLFFDPILSATRTVACATCHQPQHGWADGRPTPVGVRADGIAKDTPFLPLLRNHE